MVVALVYSVPTMPMNLDELASHTVSRSSLDKAEVDAELRELGSRWSIVGHELVCKLPSPPMAKCGAAVAYATTLADEMDHHPRIVMEYKGTTLALFTHDKNAITVLDFVYAARLERWLRQNGW